MAEVSRERKTAAERREQILVAAQQEFAERGLDGATTQAIARRVGVSQPYIFHLFGSKKELFVATVERCFRQAGAMFAAAAEGRSGAEALAAMGDAYTAMLHDDPARLRAQMQAYMACDDDDICAVVRREFGRVVDLVAGSSGVGAAELARFFATGMLLNVLASMGMLEAGEEWARQLVAGLDAQA
jgi:AcrR family transcriptional regulator